MTELQRATLTAMGNTRGCHPRLCLLPVYAAHGWTAPPRHAHRIPQGYGSCHANCGCCILRHPDVYMDGP